jgi:hypothetical protein
MRPAVLKKLPTPLTAYPSLCYLCLYDFEVIIFEEVPPPPQTKELRVYITSISFVSNLHRLNV